MNRIIRKGLVFLLVILLFASACQSETATPESAAAVPPQATSTLESILAATNTPVPTPFLSPTPEVPAGFIAEVIHLVDAHPQIDADWEEALVDMLLYAGGEVWAKEASTALIGMGENQTLEGEPNYIRVAPDTIFTLAHPEAGTVQLNLQEGQVWINIEGLSADESFQVETSTAVAAVEGTRFSVRVDEQGQTIVSTMVNTVTVSTTQGQVSVGPKRQTIAQESVSPSEPEKISDVEFIRWSLAAGPNLSVIAPLGDLVDVYTINGLAQQGVWSADGATFSFTYYLPGTEHGNVFWDHYNVTTSSPITNTLVPSNTFQISYNPVGDGVAWAQGGIGGMKICTAESDDIEPTCFSAPDTRYYVDYPVWSPDGEWLLYKLNDSNPDGADNLFISHPDGSDTRQVTFSESGSNSRYIWSPDGSQIAYAYSDSDDWETPGQAWVVNADGLNPHVILENLQNPLSYDPLPWSPDGQWLALESTTGLNLVHPDGSDSQEIHPSNDGNFYDIQWSPTPNGWPLLYRYYNLNSGYEGSGNYFIFSETTKPQDYYIGAWGPIYSPDRSLVAFGVGKRISEEPDVYESTIYFFQVLPWWP